jgi:hypothetical protein
MDDQSLRENERATDFLHLMVARKELERRARGVTAGLGRAPGNVGARIAAVDARLRKLGWQKDGDGSGPSQA